MLLPGSTTRSMIAMWLAFRLRVLLMKPSMVVAKAYVPSERYELACDTYRYEYLISAIIASCTKPSQSFTD